MIEESGALSGEYDGETLVTSERVRRRPFFAATPELSTFLRDAAPI
jgi:hypothetical protein